MPDLTTAPIVSDGIGKFIIPHASGELIKAYSASISMECFKGGGKLTPTLQMAGKPVPSLEGVKIATSNSDLKVEQLITPVNPDFNEYGGIDEIITLFKPPAKNMLIYDYESINLVPYLQPPLTEFEIKEGSFQPDHVANSIAWYHTSKGSMVTPSDVGDRITTGKAFHQYCMIATDAKGNKSWADWTILKGSQIGLVLDDKFIATAIYPIIIAPVGDTFGYTTAGSITGRLSRYEFSQAYVQSVKNTGAAGTGTSMTASLSCTGANSYKFALHQVSDNALVTNGITGENSDGPFTKSWKTLNFTSSPTLTSQIYWVSGFGNYVGTTDIFMYYDSGGPANSSSQMVTSYGGWPNPLVPASLGTNRRSIYCTYTAGGGAIPNFLSLLGVGT
jgi:hypothetical protein